MSSSPSTSIGEERFRSDKRQFGGIIFGLGICAMVGALAGVATGVSRDGGTPSENGIPLWSLIGACCQAFFGAVAIVVGYLAIVADAGHRWLTFFLCGAIQLAWIPYVTGMSGVGKQAHNPETQTFIPEYLEPTDGEIRFVGAMGILAIIATGFTFIGSLAFASFALLVYQEGRPQERHSGYYQSRLAIYSSFLILAGITQLGLGSFILEAYGSGPLDEAVSVAVYTIFFPEISVTVGTIQVLTGAVGVFRYFGSDVLGGDGWSFQIMCFFNWLMMIILQLMVQVSFAPGGQFAAAAPTRACMFVGMSFMPAYLDYKMRNTPDVIEPSYYGLSDKTGDKEVYEPEDVEEPLTEDYEHKDVEESMTEEHEEGGLEQPLSENIELSTEYE